MKYLSAHSEGFMKADGTRRHNHELLHIYRVGSMYTAVQNIHHRHRQMIAVYATQEPVKRYLQTLRGSTRSCNGH